MRKWGGVENKRRERVKEKKSNRDEDGIEREKKRGGKKEKERTEEK